MWRNNDCVATVLRENEKYWRTGTRFITTSIRRKTINTYIPSVNIFYF